MPLPRRIPGSGDLLGPGAATDNAIARWNGAGGTLLQSSGVIINDSDDISGVHSLSGEGIKFPSIVIYKDGSNIIAIGTDGSQISKSTNATTVFQAAIDSLPTGGACGGRIYVSHGSYTIGKLTINRPLVLEGEEKGHVPTRYRSILILADNTNDDMFDINLPDDDLSHYVHFLNLGFNGNKANQTTGDCIHLGAGGLQDSSFENLMFYDWKGSAFYLTPNFDCHDITLRNVFLETCDVAGFYLGGGGINKHGLSIVNCVSWGNTIDIYLDDVGTIGGYIEGCAFHDTGEEILKLEGVSKLRIVNNSFWNASEDTSNTHSMIWGGKGAANELTRVTIIGNNFFHSGAATAKYAIELANVPSENIIAHNMIETMATGDLSIANWWGNVIEGHSEVISTATTLTIGSSDDFATLSAAATALKGYILQARLTLQLSENISETSTVVFEGIISAGGELLIDLNTHTLSSSVAEYTIKVEYAPGLSLKIYNGTITNSDNATQYLVLISSGILGHIEDVTFAYTGAGTCYAIYGSTGSNLVIDGVIMHAVNTPDYCYRIRRGARLHEETAPTLNGATARLVQMGSLAVDSSGNIHTSGGQLTPV